MKRWLWLLMALTMLALACGTALAESSEPASEQNMISWEGLATMGGAIAATLFIVQFLKVPLGKVFKIPTRVLVYIIAAALMIAANIITGKAKSAPDIFLVLLNAIPVALSAMGAYELTFVKVDHPHGDEKA